MVESAHGRLRLWLGLLLVIALAAAVAGATTAERPRVERPLLVLRVPYNDAGQLAWLARYDIWENDLARREVVIGATAAQYESLRRTGWPARIDETATQRLDGIQTRDLFFGGYRTVNELYAALDSYDATYPTLVSLFNYGQSHCKQAGDCVVLDSHNLAGYDLRAMRITNPVVPGSSVISGDSISRGTKPVLFLMAAIHAREITTPELVLRFADSLLEGYGKDADATWLVDHHEIWIVPTANPDGRWVVELGEPETGMPFFHRKNFNLDADGNGKTDCQAWWDDVTQYGVDLNRNHSYQWGTTGASSDPCDLTYRGPSAASEPEVAALQALVAQLFADQRGPGPNDPAPLTTSGMLITVHSYGNLVLWPWGYYTADSAPNKAGLQAIGDKLASFSGSQSCQPTDCLYPASGTTDDWAYGDLGIPAFTFEVGNEFMPPYEEIDEIQWPAFGPSFEYAAKIVRSPYQTAYGPDAMEVQVNPVTGTVTATISDALNGGLPIAAAEYTIGIPIWSPDAQPQPLQPVDGAFDEVVEEVAAMVDTADAPPGRQILFLRGRDAQGNTGPVSAVFVTIDLTDGFRVFLPGVLDQ